jgi:ParB-like chromosome segregation protein Spo0J
MEMTMKVEMVDLESLKKGDWHCNHILRPDLLVLSTSLAEFGFITPIIARKGDGSIIDGYHRWMLAREVKQINERVKKIPVVFVDCDSLEAAMMHLRLNRGRGSLVAHKVSRVVRDLVISKKYSEEDLEKLLSMKYDEIALLLDGTIIKKTNINEHKYSRAWVPIEAPAGTVESVNIEKPPNKDR